MCKYYIKTIHGWKEVNFDRYIDYQTTIAKNCLTDYKSVLNDYTKVVSENDI